MNKGKKPFESKKFIAMAIGVTATVLFTIAALAMIAVVPTASSSIVNLVTVALASLNGCISIYALGQSAVDWKINSTHNSDQENRIVDEKQHIINETRKFEMQYE
jgi:hypothetical protein